MIISSECIRFHLYSFSKTNDQIVYDKIIIVGKNSFPLLHCFRHVKLFYGPNCVLWIYIFICLHIFLTHYLICASQQSLFSFVLNVFLVVFSCVQ